ncbi:TrkH family potassium uptake protein [Herbiconiux sp. L3-i23]|uniref:TrkH family potassium uptake protein n=1 Tax=Herbiconiux sp. L3-i23 TaxID=2905871 RepID=UPI002057FC2F|nr:potassium transporter TrkG [Herbiconiux sp. L3-i23]BDI21336.1 potassium transporter Trk [Herbiconiux sp. L3-i23]
MVQTIDRRPIGVRLRDGFTYLASRTPARFAIVIFVGLILLFTTLLSLPIMSASGRRTDLADALFTATSAICVTGLTTVDTATHWSPLGQVVIVIATQLGAVGVLTLASVMGLIVSRRLGLRQKLLAAGDVNPMALQRGGQGDSPASRLGEVGGLLATVAVSMLVIEAALAILLFPRLLLDGLPVGTAVVDALYFSAMAFTNTGFVFTDTGLAPYATDFYFLTVLMIGVVLGGLGFPVIYALSKNFKRPRRWSLHVKLTLLTTGILFLLGAVTYMALEAGNEKSFGGDGVGHLAFQSLFLSVMTRSGGFSTFDTGDLNHSSMLVTDMLMFIGGGSASTAGGIKVTTIAILFIAAFAEARGSASMEAFERKIPGDVLRLAVSVVLWGATTVALSCIVLLQLQKEANLDAVLFDVISAFGTSGLSSGFTATLEDPGKYVLSATMFMGRIGTVTLAAALAASQRRQLFNRAEERPIVG